MTQFCVVCIGQRETQRLFLNSSWFAVGNEKHDVWQLNALLAHSAEAGS